jgi:DNA-directed RNA polymerase subunit K/omega
MHSLEFEKIMDKLGSKYEAVVRMAITANKVADGDLSPERPANEKVTTTALKYYLAEQKAAGTDAPEKA